MLYRVEWEIDVEAATPEEAARKALEYQRDKNSSATVFSVYDDKGDKRQLDLTEIDEVAASVVVLAEGTALKLYDVTFENALFTHNSDLDGHSILAADLPAVPEHPGLTFVRASISEDDDQEDDDIKMFVSIVCRVAAKSANEAEAVAVPDSYLRDLTALVLKDHTYDLEDTWDTADVSAVECPALVSDENVPA
jgi:hypothetical protein